MALEPSLYSISFKLIKTRLYLNFTYDIDPEASQALTRLLSHFLLYYHSLAGRRRSDGGAGGDGGGGWCCGGGGGTGTGTDGNKALPVAESFTLFGSDYPFMH